MERYYYKSKEGKGFLNLKTPMIDENYIQISKEEFEELTKPKVYEPTAEEKAKAEITRQISACKKYLQDTDYIVLKIAELMAEGNDTTTLRSEYAEQLKLRQECRDKINELEGK